MSPSVLSLFENVPDKYLVDICRMSETSNQISILFHWYFDRWCEYNIINSIFYQLSITNAEQ